MKWFIKIFVSGENPIKEIFDLLTYVYPYDLYVHAER